MNVMGIDKSLSAMDSAKEAIKALERFFFDELGLKPTLTDLGVDDKHFAVMAQKVPP